MTGEGVFAATVGMGQGMLDVTGVVADAGPEGMRFGAMVGVVVDVGREELIVAGLWLGDAWGGACGGGGAGWA